MRAVLGTTGLGNMTITKYEGYMEYCFSGVFNDESLYQVFCDLWTKPDYESKELYDFSRADVAQVTGESIRKIVTLNRQLHPTVPQHQHAVLAENDLHYGLSRMFIGTNYELNPNLKVFRDRDEAIAWVSSEGAHPS